MTPRIKLLIDADKELNNPKNLIDVNSTDEKVTLEGHVTNEDQKSKAEEIAKKVIAEQAGHQTIVNNLTIEADSK